MVLWQEGRKERQGSALTPSLPATPLPVFFEKMRKGVPEARRSWAPLQSPGGDQLCGPHGAMGASPGPARRRPSCARRPPRRGRSSEEDRAARQGRGRESEATTSPGGSPLQVPPLVLGPPSRAPPEVPSPPSAFPARAHPTRHLRAETQNSNEHPSRRLAREQPGKVGWTRLSKTRALETSGGRRARVGRSSMASFYRWEKRGPTQQIPLLCVSPIPGGRRAVTRCPQSPPHSQASITAQNARAWRAQERPSASPRPAGAQPEQPPLRTGPALCPSL